MAEKTPAEKTRSDGVVEAFGAYSDGVTAARRRVALRLTTETLEIRPVEGGDAIAYWPLAHIRFADRGTRPEKPLRLTVADSGAARARAKDETRPSDQRLTLDEDDDGAEAFRAALFARAPSIGKPPRVEGRLRRRLLATIAAAAATVAFVLVVLIPLAATQLASVLPPEKELRIGEALADTILSGQYFDVADGGPPVCERPSGEAALKKMTERLEAVSDLHLPLTVRVARWNEVNAIALPGGQIILFKGLIEGASSADEVAGVLAHEIGHVAARDSTRRMLRTGASFAVLSLLIGDVSGGFLGAGVASALIEADNSRAVEARADESAIRILKAANVSTSGVASFFDRVIEIYGEDAENAFASHPLSKTRAAKFRDAGAGEASGAEPILTPADWRSLKRICDRRDGASGAGRSSGANPELDP